MSDAPGGWGRAIVATSFAALAGFALFPGVIISIPGISKKTLTETGFSSLAEPQNAWKRWICPFWFTKGRVVSWVAALVHLLIYAIVLFLFYVIVIEGAWSGAIF